MILTTNKPKRSGLSFNYYGKSDSKEVLATIVKLYDTIIVIAENDYIKLNSDGFRTRHTKNVINDFLPSEFRLYQKNNEWLISTPNGLVVFEDDIILKVA